MTTSKTRAEFEAWFRKEHPKSLTIARFNGSGQYAHMHPANDWIVWQAARRATLEEAAKVLEARIMGDNNREDQEAKRCVAAIRALGDEGMKP